MKKAVFIAFVLFQGICSYSQNLSHDLDSLLENYVSTQQLHGCVVYVKQNSEIAHFKAYGYQNISQNLKMRKNVIFEISSMTKLITSAAAMKLVEDGKISLSDPVKNYLPEFSNLKVLVNENTDSTRTVPLERDITIRDLLRHTAGFGYGWSDDSVDRIYRKYNIYGANQNAENFLNSLALIPLKYQPQTKWEYSCSADVMGVIIERITGMSLQDYYSREIFIPLKMKSTGFYLSEFTFGRLSGNYEMRGGKLIQNDFPLPSAYLKPPKMYWAGAGIVSTAQDLANFYSMILNYGSFKGKQILSRESVEEIVSNQISGIADSSSGIQGFGFGTGIRIDKNGKSTGIYWGGSPYNTSFFIDFQRGITAIFLTQNAPFGHLNITADFEKIVRENLP